MAILSMKKKTSTQKLCLLHTISHTQKLSLLHNNTNNNTPENILSCYFKFLYYLKRLPELQNRNGNPETLLKFSIIQE